LGGHRRFLFVYLSVQAIIASAGALVSLAPLGLTPGERRAARGVGARAR